MAALLAGCTAQKHTAGSNPNSEYDDMYYSASDRNKAVQQAQQAQPKGLGESYYTNPNNGAGTAGYAASGNQNLPVQGNGQSESNSYYNGGGNGAPTQTQNANAGQAAQGYTQGNTGQSAAPAAAGQTQTADYYKPGYSASTYNFPSTYGSGSKNSGYYLNNSDTTRTNGGTTVNVNNYYNNNTGRFSNGYGNGYGYGNGFNSGFGFYPSYGMGYSPFGYRSGLSIGFGYGMGGYGGFCNPYYSSFYNPFYSPFYSPYGYGVSIGLGYGLGFYSPFYSPFYNPYYGGYYPYANNSGGGGSPDNGKNIPHPVFHGPAGNPSTGTVPATSIIGSRRLAAGSTGNGPAPAPVSPANPSGPGLTTPGTPSPVSPANPGTPGASPAVPVAGGFINHSRVESGRALISTNPGSAVGTGSTNPSNPAAPGSAASQGYSTPGGAAGSISHVTVNDLNAPKAVPTNNLIPERYRSATNPNDYSTPGHAAANPAGQAGGAIGTTPNGGMDYYLRPAQRPVPANAGISNGGGSTINPSNAGNNIRSGGWGNANSNSNNAPGYNSNSGSQSGSHGIYGGGGARSFSSGGGGGGFSGGGGRSSGGGGGHHR